MPVWLQERLDALNKDKEFVVQTDDRRRELNGAYAQDPAAVEAFFNRHSLTSTFAEPRIHSYLATIPDHTLRRALENYVRYANRFRVQFRLRTNPLDFKVLPWIPFGKKFHVKVVEDHLEGAGKTGQSDDSFAASFSTDAVNVPRAIQELIDADKATFVRVDDYGEYSILKDLESFAYKDDGVVIIHHQAEQPYFVVIFGEKMSKEVLADLGKSVSEFQQQHFFRARGGRPANISRLKKRLEVDAKPLSNKAKAADLAETDGEKKVKVEEVRLSQFRSKRRKSNS